MDGDLPDSNNVYSTISSPVDLRTAERLLKEEFPDAKIWIKTGYNGAMTLHVKSETADFEGYPASDDRTPDHLFNGGLAGNDSAVVAKVSSLFRRFHTAGLQRRANLRLSR